MATANVKARVAGALHDGRPNPTIVASLQPGQRLATANFVQGSQSPAVIAQKSTISYVTSTGNKLTHAQMQMLKQQNLLRQQQQIKLLQAQAASGQKITATVPATGGVGVQQRNAPTLIKQAGTAGTVTQQVQAAAVKRQQVHWIF